MGVEPFLVCSSLECIIAQRLVRLICDDCKVKIQPHKEILKNLGIECDMDRIEIFEGKGCEACKFTGYRGRTAIYEILRLDDEIKQMILNKASSQNIKRKAVAKGMRTLLLDGWQKVLLGETTISEVLRVTQK
jgi:type II secretory ATPase GspE/PulE/Tfp pilus assembly ATPase PilB-like protein